MKLQGTSHTLAKVLLTRPDFPMRGIGIGRFSIVWDDTRKPRQRRDEDDIDFLDRMQRERPDLSLNDLGFTHSHSSTGPSS